jgi:hypothetical protein
MTERVKRNINQSILFGEQIADRDERWHLGRQLCRKPGEIQHHPVCRKSSFLTVIFQIRGVQEDYLPFSSSELLFTHII